MTEERRDGEELFETVALLTNGDNNNTNGDTNNIDSVV